MREKIVLFAAAAALAGCAMSTGILPAGPDTYTITERRAPIRGGATTAEQDALTEANTYCSDRGRVFLATDLVTPPSANPWGPTSYSVTFRCLRPGDPALATSGSAGAPSAIIEQRQR
jgi:hypothetical protein